MGANPDGDGSGADELVKVVRITDSDIVGRVVLAQNSFRYANAVRHDLCRSIGIAGLVELVLVRKARGEPRRDRRVHHLLPRAEGLLGALGVGRRQDKLHPAWIVYRPCCMGGVDRCQQGDVVGRVAGRETPPAGLPARRRFGGESDE